MRRKVLAGQLSALRERVERWRQERGRRGERIPEELWNAAVEAARVEGVHATCRALRFNAYSLQARMPPETSEGGSETSENGAFVELAMGQLGCGGKTVVELVGQRGGRMRIDVTGTSTVDIVGLAQAFWSRES
jgi:hypothetical protein